MLARSNGRIACGPDTFLLDGGRAQGVRRPFAYTKGVGGTCKTRKILGDVVITLAGDIRRHEIGAGLILPCCSKPFSDIDLDACSGVENLAQFPQPGLVIPPLVEPGPKDRLPHLLGACGAHAAFGLVEIEAALVKRELAEIE